MVPPPKASTTASPDSATRPKVRRGERRNAQLRIDLRLSILLALRDHVIAVLAMMAFENARCASAAGKPISRDADDKSMCW